MLTNDDLVQIKKLLHDEINLLIYKEITPLKKDIKILRNDATVIKQDVKVLTFKMKKVNEDINAVISVFDNDYKSLDERTVKIEKHLALSSA